MALTYRTDKDLEFLKDCSSEDLSELVLYLTGSSPTVADGPLQKLSKVLSDKLTQLTEKLTAEERYEQYNPDHSEYWDLIAADLQLFGGSSLANPIRGEGVLYRELLTNVCDKMKVNYNSSASVEVIETNLLMKVLTHLIEEMNNEDLRKIVEALDLKITDMSKQAVIAALQAVVLLKGFVAYQVAAIVANAVAKLLIGRGLSFTGNILLTRTLSAFAGPIGWTLTGLWTIVDIAGPAYRVTIPCAIQVAFLRAKMKHEE